jgi:hypothetical protein
VGETDSKPVIPKVRQAGGRRQAKSRGLASKFSGFSGVLLSWVVLTTIAWDVHHHTFSWAKGLI